MEVQRQLAAQYGSNEVGKGGTDWMDGGQRQRSSDRLRAYFDLGLRAFFVT